MELFSLLFHSPDFENKGSVYLRMYPEAKRYTYTWVRHEDARITPIYLESFDDIKELETKLMNDGYTCAGGEQL